MASSARLCRPPGPAARRMSGPQKLGLHLAYRLLNLLVSNRLRRCAAVGARDVRETLVRESSRWRQRAHHSCVSEPTRGVKVARSGFGRKSGHPYAKLEGFAVVKERTPMKRPAHAPPYSLRSRKGLLFVLFPRGPGCMRLDFRGLGGTTLGSCAIRRRDPFGQVSLKPLRLAGTPSTGGRL